jgi:hypothetical protein
MPVDARRIHFPDIRIAHQSIFFTLFAILRDLNARRVFQLPPAPFAPILIQWQPACINADNYRAFHKHRIDLGQGLIHPDPNEAQTPWLARPAPDLADKTMIARFHDRKRDGFSSSCD